MDKNHGKSKSFTENAPKSWKIEKKSQKMYQKFTENRKWIKNSKFSRKSEKNLKKS